MLLTEAVLGDVKLIGEPSEPPGSIAFDEETSLEVSHE